MTQKKTKKVYMREDNSNFLTEERVKEGNVILPMFESLREEMKGLATKKPDGKLNSLKVKTVNRLLESARELLANEHTLEYLDVLTEEPLPENSDVVLILSLYIEALRQYINSPEVEINMSAFSDEDLRQLEQIMQKYQK